MKLFNTVALAAGLLTVLFLLSCSAGDDLTSEERRAQELNRAIMCPVCPGESIDQSQNRLAAQMRAIVAEKLAAGESEAEIKAFFVERYGDSVLLSPPERGFNLLVWIVPVIGLAAAGLIAALALRRMRRSPRPEEEARMTDVRPIDRHSGEGRSPEGREMVVPGLSQDERDDYARRIESALDMEGPPPGGGTKGQ